MFCFASDGKQRAELFIDISDSVKSVDDSQCFSHQTDSSQLTQPLSYHTLLESTIIAP